MKVHVNQFQKIWQWYSLEWYQYHAGLCVLQERVIFQTHPGLLANTLKTRKWNWFVLLSERGAGISTGQGLAISAECRNMDYSQFGYTRKQHRSVFNLCLTWHTAWCVSTFHKNCGLPVTTNCLHTTRSCWSTMVLALLNWLQTAAGQDWPFSLCTMPSCGHVSLASLLPCYHGFHLY